MKRHAPQLDWGRRCLLPSCTHWVQAGKPLCPDHLARLSPARAGQLAGLYEAERKAAAMGGEDAAQAVRRSLYRAIARDFGETLR